MSNSKIIRDIKKVEITEVKSKKFLRLAHNESQYERFLLEDLKDALQMAEQGTIYECIVCSGVYLKGEEKTTPLLLINPVGSVVTHFNSNFRDYPVTTIGRCKIAPKSSVVAVDEDGEAVFSKEELANIKLSLQFLPEKGEPAKGKLLKTLKGVRKLFQKLNLGYEVVDDFSETAPTAVTHNVKVYDFANARLNWASAKRGIAAEIHIISEMVKEEDKESAFIGHLGKLNRILEHFGTGLEDALDEILNNSGKPTLLAKVEAAKVLVDDYREYLEDDELVKLINRNPYSEINAGELLLPTLNLIRDTLTEA